VNHERMKDMVFSLYDGELGETDRSLAEEHVASCRECRQEYENWQGISRSIFAPGQVPVGESFVQSVMRRIRVDEETPPHLGWSPFQRWATAFGYGLAVLLLWMSFVNTTPYVSTEDLVFPMTEMNGMDNTDEILDL